MLNIGSKESLEELIKSEEILLIYLGSPSCGVCKEIKPKLEELLKKYPKVSNAYVDVEENHMIGISYDFFTIPGILLFVQGKETIREARHISLHEIDRRISRYYDLIFK